MTGSSQASRRPILVMLARMPIDGRACPLRATGCEPAREAEANGCRCFSELWPSGVASFALKSPGHAETQAEHRPDPDRWGSSGARRASDVEAGIDANGSVRAVVFERDNSFQKPASWTAVLNARVAGGGISCPVAGSGVLSLVACPSRGPRAARVMLRRG